MRTTRTLLATAVAAAMVLTGCSQDDDAPDTGTSPTTSASQEPTSEPSEEPSSAPKGVVVDITIKGDTVTPSGDRVQAEVGEPVILQVTADRAGELHVHSTPEQELEFDEGDTQLELSIDKPGVVDIEDHESDTVIVQLEVS